jgi:hypothetical protein
MHKQCRLIRPTKKRSRFDKVSCLPMARCPSPRENLGTFPRQRQWKKDYTHRSKKKQVLRIGQPCKVSKTDATSLILPPWVVPRDARAKARFSPVLQVRFGVGWSSENDFPDRDVVFFGRPQQVVVGHSSGSDRCRLSWSRSSVAPDWAAAPRPAACCRFGCRKRRPLPPLQKGQTYRASIRTC